MQRSDITSTLNQAQRAAVAAIDGPVLVIAGPGTGKTQLLSARAAQILEQTDARPGNILCLTFTERAATNMQERLIELIGPEARKIMVKTFHGLGAELINLYPQYFYNAARLQPAPEIVQRQAIEEILATRPLDDPLTLQFYGHYTLVGQIIKDIDLAKRAGLNPQRLRAVAEANLAYLQAIDDEQLAVLNQRITKSATADYQRLLESLPKQDFGQLTAPIQPYAQVLYSSLEEALSACESENSTRPLTEWKQTWTTVQDGSRVFKDVGKSQRLLALSEVYGAYQTRLHEQGYFDYSDMILEVLDQLQQREDLLTEVQERFSYIMIDEFQDTNDAQFRLAYLIANHPVHEGRPNLMAVGDDDQAIYRFQGAELSNMEAFVSAFPDAQQIVLAHNYRSHASVLETVEAVAAAIEYRLVDHRDDLDKRLQASNDDIPAGAIEHVRYPDQAQQYSDVADRVKQALQQEVSVAVIARSHRSLEALASVLHQRGVPLRYERSTNILEHPVVELVADLAALLKALAVGDEDQADYLASTLLVHPVWGITPEQAYRFAVTMRHRSGWVPALQASDAANLAAVGETWLELMQLSRELPAGASLEYLLGLRPLPSGYTLPLRSYYLDKELDTVYIEALAAFEQLRELSEEFVRTHQPKLDDFTDFLRLNQRHEVIIPQHVTFMSGEHSAELLTAHAAKGLEFDQVFLIDAIDSNWKPRHRGQSPPANLPSLQPYGEHDDDYARLLYVAMTRARSHLTLTSYEYDRSGKYVPATPLISHVEVTSAEAETDILSLSEQVSRWPRLHHDQYEHILRPLLQDFQLSITHILNFLDIESGGPHHFIERNLLRIPDVKSPYMSYGSAIHAALEAAHHQVNQENLDVQAVQAVFADRLSQEHIDPDQLQRYRVRGEQLLQSLLGDGMLELQPGDQPERNLRSVRCGPAVISGKLDVVRSTENGVHVIDYKTGKAPSSLQTTSQADGLKARSHRLQIMFYALLLQEAGIVDANQACTGEMVYLEASKKRFSQTYQPAPADIDYITRLTQAVWWSLQNLDWPDISTYGHDLEGVIAFEQDLIARSESNDT